MTDRPPILFFRTICPEAWLEKWDDQREAGTFPTKLDQIFKSSSRSLVPHLFQIHTSSSRSLVPHLFQIHTNSNSSIKDRYLLTEIDTYSSTFTSSTVYNLDPYKLIKFLTNSSKFFKNSFPFFLFEFTCLYLASFLEISNLKYALSIYVPTLVNLVSHYNFNYFQLCLNTYH